MVQKVYAPRVRSVLFAASYIASAAVILYLHGCANLSSENPGVDWQHGAKRGTVSQIFTADSPVEGLPSCLAGLPKPLRQGRQFAHIEYRHIRHLFATLAEIPRGSVVKVGQQIEVWPVDCTAERFARIGKTFPAGTQP